MSGGVHRLWKDHFINSLAPSPTKLIDVAGGTGDIAFRFLDSVKRNHGGVGQAQVTVLDINPAMLQVGRERALKLGYPVDSPHISFQEANAEHLETIPDASVDAYTIAFAFETVLILTRSSVKPIVFLNLAVGSWCLNFPVF
ncbi:ubiquinone/menaquinone biosynthesis C-methyltransferase UbiE [Batrachochytrium salamandrivorans]|nr:ubiquinone/menaquinone biosynthesis C-methyltransferase UbiE [Batrachochytrium salamandrivorans]